MQKSEAQRNPAQSQSAPRQGGTAVLDSPQGEQIAQLEAMVEASPQAGKLAQFAAMADNSPSMAAQRKAINAIHNSPNMTFQRQRLDSLAGQAAQRQEAEDPLQAKVAQREEAPAKPNNTGLPDNLKSGIESLSGMSMDNVKVHYNSPQPAQLNALAYAQGADIHVASGQEQHLPHEAWHVVQQAQGRVKPTMQMKDGVPVNDDQGLEHEADVMGARAVQHAGAGGNGKADFVRMVDTVQRQAVVQRLTGYELETNIPVYSERDTLKSHLSVLGQNEYSPEIGSFITGGLEYGENYGEDQEGHFVVSSDHNELQTLHRRLVDKLVLLGLIKPGKWHRNMANIEYITPPRAELGPGSLADHRADISAVKKHLDATHPLAVQGGVQDVPAPAIGIKTGIPEAAITNWVTRNGIEAGHISTELDNYKAAINKSFYVQETAGVLPEDIPSLYGAAETYIRDNDNAGTLDKLMAGVLAKSVELAETVVGSEALEPATKGAVKGMLALLGSYVLAHYLSFLKQFTGSDSTSKNLVPFLSKIPLQDAFAALPSTVRPTGQDDDPWNLLVTRLATEASAYDTRYWSETYGKPIDSEAAGRVFTGAVTDSLKGLLKGQATVRIGTGKPLSLDDPHAEVESATGQKGIPLEDRFYKSKFNRPLTSETIESDLSRRFVSVASVLLGHVPTTNDTKDRVATEATTGRTQAQEVEFIRARIGRRIAWVRKYHPILAPHLMDIEAENPAELLEQGLNPIEQELVRIGTIDDATQALAAIQEVDATIYAVYSEMQHEKARLVTSNKNHDKVITTAGAAKRLKEAEQMPLAESYLPYYKKQMKAEHLREQADQEEMTSRIEKVNKFVRWFQSHSSKLELMPEETPPSERMKWISIVHNVVPKINQAAKEAMEFYDSKPKIQ